MNILLLETQQIRSYFLEYWPSISHAPIGLLQLRMLGDTSFRKYHNVPSADVKADYATMSA
jgi:hypothetical protein